MTTPNGRNEVEQTFGNPAEPDGRLDPGWEYANIITVPPPMGWHLYYQKKDSTLLPTSGIRMHKLLQDSFREVLTQIWNHARLEVKNEVGFDKTTAEYDELTRKWLHDRRLDQHNGGYNYRPVTGGSTLSMHAYGIAIDWDALHNPRKNPLTHTLPDWWYQIWRDHGWTDGRHFNTPDPMHVQFAKGV